MFPATDDFNESQPSTSFPPFLESSQPCRLFEFREILLATDNFNESLVIGKGGFGKVYKGFIINGPTASIAAIKRLDPESSQGASEFWAEVKMLSNFRHSHVVSLFGYCNYEKEMILIYQYMPNGTLQDHLHKLGTPLSWLQRLKICLGAARGLDYLHTGTGTTVGVIHRDVKSSNILLDETWAAKISDFGLSKIGPTNQSSTNVNTHVKGTFGYLDPDYSFTGMLTRKSDVYAFGVVLLEVLCRKPAVDWSLGEEPRNLARWAQESIKDGSLKHIIDSGIKGEISPKCLKEFVRIALKCLLFNPKQRPTMAEVVVSLDSVVTLQEKTNTSLQAGGKTLFGKMLDKFPSPSNQDNSAHGDSKLSSKGNNINTSLKVFKLSDMKRATRNFSLDLLLGEGSSGKVFLGWIDKNTFAPSTEGVGIAVAVKWYNKGHTKEWQRELTILGGLTHPNIVSLLGYCNDKQSQRLIVYEYMHNQDLSHFLFGGGNDSVEPLLWGTRIKIMIGVARGLAYLHSLKDQVIHCDVKPSNILLDQDFNAKLGGFGMAARLAPETREPYETTRVMGTFGYQDPEYVMTGHLTLKSDVYSFGVVLLETLTGRRASKIGAWDSDGSDYDHNLVTRISSFLAERSTIGIIMDPRLQKRNSLQGAFECATLALRCIDLNREERPSIEEVLRTLVQIYAEQDPEAHVGQLKRFSLSELQVATDNFSNSKILGRGGFGKVYIGRLADGSLVAVKRMKEERTPGVELQFQTEIEMISMVVHPHLRRLQGFCTTPTERLLVFPYMANGSLASRLRERPSNEPPLDWPTRKRIALGIAHGLSYMHDCEPILIHRDVKAANILLDEEFEAVLGDFSLVKSMDYGYTHMSTAVRGTIGHIPPEYLATGKASDKTDVFGYGVTLLELITGRRAFDLARLANDDDVMLLDWVRRHLEEQQLEMLVDPDLEANYVALEVGQLIQVALLCTQPYPLDRPKMSDVVRMLDGDGLTERWNERSLNEVTPALHHNLDWIIADSVDDLDNVDLSGPR